MLLSRVLGAVGRFCISLGVLTLLFVAYQLWGTGILTAQAQNGLENDFEDLLEEAAELDADPAVASEESGGEESEAEAPDGEPADEGPTEEELALEAAELELLSNLLWRPEGEPVAKLSIPDIGLDWTVVSGVGTDPLRNGPGHYPGTPLPGMGGNAGIAGHRTTWGAPFNRIDELDPGDLITVQTVQGRFEYRVMEQENGKGHFIVTPDRVDVLSQGFTDRPNRLTLTACHPKFSARQRIIVVAELIGAPAPTIPRPDSLGDVEVTLASEDFSEDGSTESVVDDGGLPGDPDLDDGPRTDGENPDTDDGSAADAADGDEAGDTDGADDADDAGDDAADDGDDPDGSGSADSRSDDGGAAGVSGDDDGTAQAVGLQEVAATDDFGQGLNGDRGAIFPAIMWGLAATAIAAAAGFAARRWKKWPSYVLAVTPFAIVLFVCFVHIDQALPSY